VTSIPALLNVVLSDGLENRHVELGSHALTERRVDLREDRDRTLADRRWNSLHVHRDRLNHAVLAVLTDNAPEHRSLRVVVVSGRILLVAPGRFTQCRLGFGERHTRLRSLMTVGRVVYSGALIVAARHHAIALVRVVDLGAMREVHVELLVVSAETVAMRIGVGEEPRLQHLIGRPIDPGHEVRRSERQRLDLRDVVLRIPVENHPPHGDQRIIFV